MTFKGHDMVSKIELKTNQTILFTGDSITDCNRFMLFRPLGNGYVSFIGKKLKEAYPELNHKIINTGISGNTTRDLVSRWQKDCIDHQADVLSILIGINDLWRQYGTELDMTMAVYPEEYGYNYRRMLTEVKERCNCQIILVEPFMFTNNTDNEMFTRLRDYTNIVQNLADEFDTALLGLQRMINETLVEVAEEKFSEDLVHPSPWAHEWIAQRWLEAVNIKT
jgi:lysophospholipase L1-like esterase